MSDFYGTWNVLQNSPMGKAEMTLKVSDEGGTPSVSIESRMVEGDVVDVKIDGDVLTAVQKLRKPMPGDVDLTLKLTSPTTFEGAVKSKFFPALSMAGTKAG